MKCIGACNLRVSHSCTSPFLVYISGVTASSAPQMTYIMNQSKESAGQKAEEGRSLTHFLSDVRSSCQSCRDIGDVVWFNVYGKYQK